MRTALFSQNKNKTKTNPTMKQINTTVFAQFKAVCRKTLLASALLCGFSMMANAQTQDGRDFSIDGFAAYEGVAGSNWYRAGGGRKGQYFL